MNEETSFGRLLGTIVLGGLIVFAIALGSCSFLWWFLIINPGSPIPPR